MSRGGVGGGGESGFTLTGALTLRVCVRRFQMPLEGLKFVKTSVTFGIIYVTDPLLQNMNKIVFLR